jgi:hypothetical protein
MQKISAYPPPSTPPKRLSRDEKQITTSPELDAVHRWSTAFWTSKVVCQRQNHCHWKNQTEASCPQTRDRTSELTPHMTTTSGEETITASLHPQTKHRIHHLPSVIYADNRLCVLLDNTLMSTHASVLIDSVGPPSAEVCRAAASFS